MERPEDGGNVLEERSGGGDLASFRRLGLLQPHKGMIEVQLARKRVTNLFVMSRVEQELPVSITTSFTGAASLAWTCGVSNTGIVP